jgi:hypothetical protein
MYIPETKNGGEILCNKSLHRINWRIFDVVRPYLPIASVISGMKTEPSDLSNSVSRQLIVRLVVLFVGCSIPRSVIRLLGSRSAGLSVSRLVYKYEIKIYKCIFVTSTHYDYHYRQ